MGPTRHFVRIAALSLALLWTCVPLHAQTYGCYQGYLAYFVQCEVGCGDVYLQYAVEGNGDNAFYTTSYLCCFYDVTQWKYNGYCQLTTPQADSLPQPAGHGIAPGGMGAPVQVARVSYPSPPIRRWLFMYLRNCRGEHWLAKVPG